ncbi:UNVERIFIED_CONTAM: hypothetical protein GTU68_022105 [Idotea baltica]|nr:hypothetical protein [Idotea baltica]
MPSVRGTLVQNRSLNDLTWLKVGGPAEWFFQPADIEDLAQFLKALPKDIPVFPLGVGSNLIVRDGGIKGVVIRLGRGFNSIDEINALYIRVGAAMLDKTLAINAAYEGADLSFLRTIPGSVGGAVRMNAGCYGTYVSDVLLDVTMVTRTGTIVHKKARDLNLAYRSSDVPDGAIITHVNFKTIIGDRDTLLKEMEEKLSTRNATQPTKDRSAGSTFRNPADLKAWKVIDDAGMRGARVGGAQMSEKHSNFMINTGGATAQDLETLGEEVRKKVFQNSGIELEWEIMRVGEPIADKKPE